MMEGIKNGRKIIRNIDFLYKRCYNNITNKIGGIVICLLKNSNMSIEKQELYNEINTLPEELMAQVIDFIEYLKLSHLDQKAPDSVTIKNKKDLKENLQKGLEDINNNKVYSVDEVFTNLDNI